MAKKKKAASRAKKVKKAKKLESLASPAVVYANMKLSKF